MNVYSYQADIYCEDCGKAIIEQVKHQLLECGNCPKFTLCEDLGLCLLGEVSEDSEVYPQGPYSDGGGEADCPQHCGACGLFLENPLTDDGELYVKHALEDYRESRSGNREVLITWFNYYYVKATFGEDWK